MSAVRAFGGVRAFWGGSGGGVRAFWVGTGQTCSCLHLWLFVKAVNTSVIFFTITSLPLLPLLESHDTRTVSPTEYSKVGNDSNVDGSFSVFGMIRGTCQGRYAMS